MKKEYNISGMGCAACSAKIENKLKNQSGVINISVNLLSEKMMIEFDEKIISHKDIKNIVTKLGYGISEATGFVDEKSKNKESTGISLILSIVFLIPLMYISMGHMLGMTIPPFLHDPRMFSTAQFILTLIIILLNKRYFISGFKHLFTGSPNMDSLIAIGSLSAFLYGIYITVNIFLADNAHQLIHELYFESSATILTLISLGKYLENKSKKKTGTAIKKLISLAPKTAFIYKDDKEIEIDAKEIQIGDIVVIKAGQTAPVDGVVVFGNASFDQSAITGESIPVYKEIDDEVTSATTNTGGYVRIKATKVGSDTTLSEIIRLMEEASNSKAPISKIADRVSAIFVPVVICIAVITFIIWYFTTRDFPLSFSMGVSVLVISCPCALGLATPVAIMTGTGAGARLGILIKSGEALEGLSKTNVVVFDKTGTVTEGKPAVQKFISYINDEEFAVKIAASAEQYSTHPLAKAILEYAKNTEISLLNATTYNDFPGKGIIAEFNGKKYLAGNLRLLEENGISPKKNAEKPLVKGATVVYLSDEKEILGEIYISDSIKPSSKKALQLIKDHKIKTVILTGDGEEAATTVSEEIGADETYSNVLPSRKAEVISQMQSQGKSVCMVGDGINDAPALETADVGIAVGAGTDIAIEAADIIISQSNLVSVETAFRLSKAVMNNIKLNLFWAFFYNIIGIPIAAGVFYPLFGLKLNPMFAAFAMSISSLCVVTNALRLIKFK